MFLTAKVKKIIDSISTTVEQAINYILKGVNKVFAPSTDEYPATGVQPFEGTLNKK